MKQYTIERIEFFSSPEWIAKRQEVAPFECDHGKGCWVMNGPPCMNALTHCIRCNKGPKK